MSQIFVFGSSSAHGVGGAHGGWADILKSRLHHTMYAEGGIGERHQFYNFSKPGAKIEFVKRTFVSQLQDYKHPGKVMAIAAVGGNNVKAENKPDNFVSTVERYHIEMTDILKAIQEKVDSVLVLGFKPYNEAKTMPKKSFISANVSYFSNARTKLFHESLREICEKNGYLLIEMDDPDNWIKNCIHEDGLHPNDIGHQKIADQIWPYLVKFLDLPCPSVTSSAV